MVGGDDVDVVEGVVDVMLGQLGWRAIFLLQLGGRVAVLVTLFCLQDITKFQTTIERRKDMP